AETLGERSPARRARRIGIGDLDAVGEIDQAAGMRRYRHAEADDGYTGTGHVAPSCNSLNAGQGPNHCTGSMVIAGTYAISIITATSTSMKGMAACIVAPWSAPPTRAVVKIRTPSGGVSAPITMLSTMMMPKWIGSIPAA